jgi:hypothetical protein
MITPRYNTMSADHPLGPQQRIHADHQNALPRTYSLPLCSRSSCGSPSSRIPPPHHPVWTEVSFDVPSNVDANICRINFHINTNPSKNAPRTLSGDAPYTFLIYRMLTDINQDTDSWNSHPKTTNYVATVTLTPGGGVTLLDGWFQCPMGDVAQFLLTPVGSRAFKYTWFELDYASDAGGPHGITLEMHT